MAKSEFKLQEGVTGKYLVHPSFLGGRKLLFPKQHVHGVAHKPLHELTLEEVDRLLAAGVCTDIFQLKKNIKTAPVETTEPLVEKEVVNPEEIVKPKRNYRRSQQPSES